MKRRVLMGVLAAGMVLTSGAALATPGILQLAVRAGFWSNLFPDSTLMLQHLYYNTYDQVWDDKGDEVDVAKTKITANFTRIIRPWHFGDQKQYQVILQGIIPLANVSWEGDLTNTDSEGNPITSDDPGSVGGMMDPMTYTAIGWNNAAKTTAVQTALVVRFPLGDTDLSADAWAAMPVVAVQQKVGSMFMVEGSVGYWKEFDNLKDTGKGKDYLELNGIGTVMFGKGWDAFLQADYTKYGESETAGDKNDDEGFNFTLSPGIGNWFRPNMQLSFKYDMDIDGENTAKSSGFNVRYVWIF